MSNRGIFVAAFLTAVLVVAGAFALPELFFFELFKSLIYILIAVMVFFGENQYSYMLGMVVPLLWFITDFFLAGFFADLQVLIDYLRRKGVPQFDTPLHGLAILTETVLVILCFRAWNKEVGKPVVGKTLGVSLAIGLFYVGTLFGWYVFGFAKFGRMP